MEEDTEYLKLPVDEKVVHKLWKARLNGYEEVTKLFRQQDDDKSPEFQKYLGLVKKFVVDSNAVAQEKGLEAALAYVESYALAGKTAGEVVSGIIGKCIAAPKTRTKELAVQIILMYIEAERAEVVQEELIKGMEHKNPKISAACVACSTQALREFGSKVITIKTLVKKISTLLEDRDKTVREEGKAMVVEMYRWVGAALKPQLANLKPVQVSELEAEFEKVKPGQAQPTRYLRSQQERQAKMAVETASEDGEGGDETEEAPPADVDPLELVDPVDILSQLPKDFYEKLESKKWQERKEAVDVLEKLIQAPKLEAGDYGELVRVLKKIIAKDSNVVVVGVAGKCLAGLASGLKKKFSPYASACIPTVLEKFKEKKINVVTAMREASDAIYVSSSIESIQEDVLVALESKNPQVKLETASFLARCFAKCTPTQLNKKLLKAYVTILLKMLTDPDPLVRDNSAEALGTAMKVVGEKSMAPLINDVEAAKQNKIRECCEKAVVAKVRATSAPVKKTNEPKPVARPNTATITVKRAVAKKPAAQAVNTAAASRAKAVTKPLERELSQEEVDEKAVELFSEATINEMGDSNYKLRLAAVELFSKVVSEMDASERNAQLLLRILNKKPGFKDNNFQVLKVRLEAVKIIAEAPKLSSTAVGAVLTDIAGNLGDAKNSSLTAQVLSCLAEATSLDAIATPVMELIWNQKSPKLQAEALMWLSGACEEFGLCLEMSTVSEWVKKGLASTNQTVRSGALAVVNSLVPFVGNGMSAWFSSEKPAIQQLIQAEIDKREGDVAPTATRVQASQPTVSPTRQREGPLTDISELITDQLIGQLQDKNWKERMEALQKVEKLVSGKKISNNLGELPQMLTSRLVDSNSKIAAEAMSICQALATSLGRHGSIHLRSLFPTIVLGLGDSKPLIRKAAAACLNSWGEHCGWEEFFSGEMLADAFKTGSPQLRADLWSWLLAVFDALSDREEGKPLPKDELKALLPHLYSNVEDRNPEVRKAAAEVVLPIMSHLGYRIMLDAADKLKPGNKATVATHLDHARAELPRDVKENVREPPSKMTGSGDAKARPKTAGTQKKAVSAVKPTSRGKKEEESDMGPVLQANNLKHQRSIDEMKLKVLKWVFTTPRDEFIELLRDQLTTSNANKTLITHMFHSDFKYHLKAIEMLTEDFKSSNKATIANLDLILKWMTLRFFDTNPSVLLKGLDYLQAVFESLSTDDPPDDPLYQLTDFEASSFIPYLLIKIGDPKDAVRSGVKSLFYSLALMYPHSKLFSLIMDGLKSKNARQRTECLELLAYFIGQYPVNLTTSLKEIARHIADRDNSVRNAALNCIVKAWQKEGDRTYKMIGQLSDKDMSLLEERIKRADKAKRTMPAVQPKQAQQSAAPRAPEPEEEEEEDEEEVMETYCPPPTTFTRTAVVKPSVSGPFGLDFELLERIEGAGLELQAPQLAEFDLNDILNDEPPMIPKAISSESRGFAPTLTPPKPLQRINACTNESQTIDLVLSCISSIDHATANLAMTQLDTLMQSDMATLLVTKADTFVMAAVMQLRLLHQASSVTAQPEQLAKTYRTLMMLLITFYKNSGLAERVSKNSIRDLMEQFLHLLVEERLQELDNGTTFIRVTNMLVVKVIEKSDRTAITCALIKILHEGVGNLNTSPRFIELVMKCLWKVVKMLPGWGQQLEYNVVLLETHLFLKAYPTSMWKKRSSDMPLRTIKTILHTMVKMKGSSITQELDLVDNSHDSELAGYLNKLIKAVKQEPSPQQRLTKSTHEQLSEVFRKIGSKDQTQEGLSNLYDFRASHPEADIEPFLAKSSKFFQQYIAEGMQAIEKDRAALADNTERSVHGGETEKSASYYMSRLRNLQQMAGLQETDYMMGLATNRDDDLNQNNQLNEDKQELSSILRSPNSTTVANLDSIRQRLDRVKSMALRDESS